MFKTPVTAECLLEAATAGFSRAVYFSMHELITSLCGFLKGCQGKLDTGWNLLLTKTKSLSSTNGFGDNPTLEMRNNHRFLSGEGMLPNRQPLDLSYWKWDTLSGISLVKSHKKVIQAAAGWNRLGGRR